MKDIIQEEITIAYKQYCEYIDNDESYYSQHEHWKNSLSHFMEWMDLGYIKSFN